MVSPKAPTPESSANNPNNKPWYKKWWIIIIILLGIAVIGNAINGVNAEKNTTSNIEQKAAKTDQPESTNLKEDLEKKQETASASQAEEEKKKTESQANAMTPGQNNAVRKAERYLQLLAFSRTGLIKQLEFEKFSNADATFAVDHIKVDWNEQAAKKAKRYLELQAFSRGGLMDQLIFEGFTPEQAEHGVNSAGL